MISIVDTDCDPGMVDIPIPGNDDAYRSIEVILSRLADSIIAGRDKLVAQQAEEAARKASEERKAKDKEKTRNLTKENRAKEFTPPQPAPGADAPASAKAKPKLVVTPEKGSGNADANKETPASDAGEKPAE